MRFLSQYDDACARDEAVFSTGENALIDRRAFRLRGRIPRVNSHFPGNKAKSGKKEKGTRAQEEEGEERGRKAGADRKMGLNWGISLPR